MIAAADPPRRSTGLAIQGPRIAYRAEIAGDRAATHGELMQVRFSNQDGSGLTELRDHKGVLFRHTIVEQHASDGGPGASRVDVVLNGQRYAMQRPAESSPRGFSIKSRGLPQRVFPHDRDERIELWIVISNARQQRLHQRNGRRLSCAQLLARFSN